MSAIKRELRTDSDRLRRKELLNVKFERDALAAVLDYFPIGIVILDGYLKPLQMNRVAREILGEGPQRPGRKKVSTDGPSMPQLMGIIGDLMGQHSEKPLRFHQIQGKTRTVKQSYEMLLVSLEDQPQQRTPTVIFLCDPKQKQIADPRILMETYALTRSEAIVAAMLVDGNSLEDIAEKLGVEMSTARSHLKRVFAKTDTHRQSDLVRMLMQGLSRLSIEDLKRR